MLLATSSHSYVEHALEAVRLYTKISSENLTDTEREDVAGFLKDANKLLDKARQDQTKIGREIQKKLTGGMTMEELHEAQIEEMHKRLDTEEAGITDEGHEEIPDSQEMPGLTDESQCTESRRTESLRTESQRTGDSQDTVMGMDIDDLDEPLPDIVRYKIGSGQKKDGDEL
ncbi:hypothetical protein FAGAP_7023 [Fusarium agapanthi]|uniref:Uncharacterized protein n=1 Tax=Fusarium agapanthi TaxID=1803897 RepID=A0A9P5B748_9HYPO|nr:hypothetical protein FAGAP_7023 [Fusarium agapanthi]